MHELFVSLFGALPLSHGLQTDNPAVFATNPSLHDLHVSLEVAASTELYFPGAHKLHVLEDPAPVAVL